LPTDSADSPKPNDLDRKGGGWRPPTPGKKRKETSLQTKTSFFEKLVWKGSRGEKSRRRVPVKGGRDKADADGSKKIELKKTTHLRGRRPGKI